MQTTTIDYHVPQGWYELGDTSTSGRFQRKKQLRYVYELIAAEHSTDEIKALCLLRWSDTRVIGLRPYAV